MQTKKRTLLLLFLVIPTIILLNSCKPTKNTEKSTETTTDIVENFTNVAFAVSAQKVKKVTGYLVGEPISNTEVRFSNFQTDNHIAIAKAQNETDISKLLFVELPESYQASIGLKTNPTNLGSKIDVVGYLNSSLDHAALTSIYSINIETPKNDNTDEYYKSALGLTGSALKTALHEIIADHTMLTYSAVWGALMDTDEDPNNKDNVILLYTGESRAKSLNGGNLGDWNREHVWAKSHGDFGEAKGPGTDIHHLRPTDVTVNSIRGNKDFDDGGSSLNQCKIYSCKTDSDSFEPDDNVKGDIARMLFYMDVRYEGDDLVDLELNDEVNNGSTPYHGKLSTLLEWHLLDPVDDFERRRNEVIYEDYQHNRNPFIDHPEWANLIWDEAGFTASMTLMNYQTDSEVVYFSEYIESGSTKAIEIYNGSGKTIDLSDYTVTLFSNGKTTVQEALQLSGELVNGDVYVIGNSAFSEQVDITHKVAEFNGNDALELSKNGVVIDVIGYKGSDAYYGEDVTLVRKSSTTIGNTTFTPSEWDEYELTTDYLGFHNSSASKLTDEAIVNIDKASLTVKYTDEETILLPTQGANGSAITWASSLEAVISPNGIVTRPRFELENISVNLTATIKYANATTTKVFTITVPKETPELVTISEAISLYKAMKNVTVRGYVIALDEKIYLADKQNETDEYKMLIIELANDAKLTDNIGKIVDISGDLYTFATKPGLKRK